MTQIPHRAIPGVALPASQLMIGCDNKANYDEGAPVWDAWITAGGNTFDTAHIYGGGTNEKALGDWIARRGIAAKVNVIAKGAHTPNCTPAAIGRQLAESLDRLQLDRVPIYIMHRDNPDVPVSEFVDALNALKVADKIGIFGGSNWSTTRLSEANAYAAARGLQGMSILNNNLSLAVMERAIWPGCITSNTAADLAFLRQTNTVHVAWSSQARGYFLPAELRNRLPADTGPDHCYGSTTNEERRKRAETLAGKYGVAPHHVALAWVLAQSFPSFALIGPRSAEEIENSLPALSVAFTADEVKWLNLE